MERSSRCAPVLRYLRAVFGPDADGTSDAALLARFAAERDERAFELLVWRHAAGVVRACRAVLGDYHAAEDAAQAVFLALARQAGAVGRRGTIAGWLHRVARRVALRAATRARGRRAVAAELGHLPDPAAVAAEMEPDRDRILHEEIAGLPDKLRAPLLLCFFDGLTHAAAARRLGWPVGTVAGRVAEAKARLRRRLLRRGLGAALAAAAGLPAAVGRAAMVSPAFVDDTTRAAVAFAAGRVILPEVSPLTLELAKGVSRTMSTMKLAWFAGLAAVCGGLALGAAWADRPGRDSAPDNAVAQTRVEPDKPAAADAAGGPAGAAGAPARGANGGLAVAPPGAGPAVDGPGAAPAAGGDGAAGLIANHKVRVLGPDNRAPRGATVYVRYANHSLTGHLADGADGRVFIPVSQFSIRDGRAVVEPVQVVAVAVAADGLGFGWVDPAALGTDREPTLRLVEDTPVLGRILDAAGAPVGRAVVQVEEVRAYPRDDLGSVLSALRAGRPVKGRPDVWTGPVPGQFNGATTDAAGRFRLTGLGRGRVVRLRVEAPGAAPAALTVVTAAPKDGDAPYPARDSDGRPLYGPSFDHHLPSPARE